MQHKIFEGIKGNVSIKMIIAINILWGCPEISHVQIAIQNSKFLDMCEFVRARSCACVRVHASMYLPTCVYIHACMYLPTCV